MKRHLAHLAVALVALVWALGPLACGGSSAHEAGGDSSVLVDADTLVADDDAPDPAEVFDAAAEIELLPLDPCAEDRFEPNETADNAPLLPSGPSGWLTLCAPEVDWFRLELTRSESVGATLGFDRALGYLQAELFDSSGLRVAVSRPIRDGGRITYTAPANGTYYLRVAAPLGALNRYQLDTTRVTQPCIEEDGTPFDTPATARVLAPDEVLGTRLCGQVERWVRLAIPAGREGFLTISVAPGAGSVAASVYRGGDTSLGIQLSEADLSGRRVLTLPLRDDGYLLRLVGSASTRAEVNLGLKAALPGVLVARRYHGLIRYEDRPLTKDGFGAPVFVPVRRASLELRWTEANQLLLFGQTDEEGRYRFEVVVGTSNGVTLRVLPKTESGHVSLSVRGTLDATMPRFIDRTLPIDSNDVTFDLDIDEAGEADTFNILDIARESLDYLVPLGVNPTIDQLRLVFTPGVVDPCTTCYNPGWIFVSGSSDDPDAFDDSVLAHEIWHFIEDAFSRRDTPGGFHDGTRTNPALAFSEGFAHFFQALVRGSADYLDFRSGKVRRFRLDNVLDPETFGTSDGTISGLISENLIDAALWQLYTGTASRLPVPYELLLWPLLLPLRSPSFVDRGAPGVDWLDYLDGLRCLQLGLDPWIQSVVIDERQFPYDFAGPTTCLDP